MYCPISVGLILTRISIVESSVMCVCRFVLVGVSDFGMVVNSIVCVVRL